METFYSNSKNAKHTMKNYIEDIKLLTGKINRKYDSIYPIPRGGYLPAIIISQELNIPISFELTKNSLIVDDLIDSGKTLSNYSQDKAVVYVKNEKQNEVDYFAVKAQGWINLPDEQGTGIEENIKRIFQFIGENPDREGLKDTPTRIARMFKEIYRGYNPEEKPKITVFQNGTDGIIYDNMVIDEGEFYSVCEHHMMPFFGRYWFAYIPHPNGKILGISKIGRVIDYCAAKLQVQERLVYEVVKMLSESLESENEPLGLALVMEGTHLCKTMRGAKKNGKMTSSYLTGVFKEDSLARSEFMNLIKK